MAFIPSVAQLVQEFRWLRDHGVSAVAIANAFGIQSGRVRTLLHRHAQLRRPDDCAGRSKPVTFRRSDMVPVDDHKRIDRIEETVEAIRDIRTGYGRQFREHEGVKRLNALLPFFGFSANPQIRRAEAVLYQTRAWFYANAGLSRSAWLDASRAAAIARLVIADTTSPQLEDVRSWMEASRSRVHALTLTRQPERALEILASIRTAAQVASMPRSAEYFRLLGVARLQLGHDREAIAAFESAHERALDARDYTHPVQPAMTGVRHLNLLRRDWDAAELILAGSREYFGLSSLEASMAAHWLAAAVLATDSRSATRRAWEVLAENEAAAASYGHQATVWRMLSATERLGLKGEVRREWVRRALYANAFRSK